MHSEHNEDKLTQNEINAWHAITMQRMNDEGDMGGELIETPYFREEDARCRVGDEVIFRPPQRVRPFLSNPEARFTGRILKVAPGHEILYTVELHPPLPGIEGAEALFQVAACDCVPVGC